MWALLSHGMDVVACEFAIYAIHDCDINMFLFAIQNGNEIFLKYALKEAIFSISILHEEKMILTLLDGINNGARIELCLKIIGYVDFYRWNSAFIKRLVNFLKLIQTDRYENNKLLYCVNPILAITLACEVLAKIGNTLNIFKSECKEIQGALMGLGH